MEERRRGGGVSARARAANLRLLERERRGKQGPKLYLGAIRAGKERLGNFFSTVLYAGAPKSQLDTFLQPVSSPAPVSEGDDDDDDV